MNQPPIDDANAPIESTLLHRAWRDLLRASPAYWSVQGVVFVGSMLLAWMALRSLNPVQQEGENAVQLFLLRNSV